MKNEDLTICLHIGTIKASTSLDLFISMNNLNTGFARKLRAGFRGFAVSAFCIIFLAGPAAAIEYGGFGGRPAYPREDNPRTESIFVHTLEPGEVKQEGIVVLNNTQEQKSFEVYAADSVHSSGGGFACKQISEPKEDVGAWVKLEENIVTLNSASNKTVPFTISVPEHASVGEHNGCILIQEVKLSEGEDGQKSGARISFRTGLRIAITIPGDLVRKLEIASFSASKQEDGDILLHPEVKNTGNVSIDADMKIVTQHLLGFEREENGGVSPVLRGETAVRNFVYNKPFWGGLYRSSLSILYDENEGATVGVNTKGEQTRLKGATVWFFSAPKLPALLMEIVILAAIIYAVRYLLKRKKKDAWIRKQWVGYAVQPNEDINVLATRFGVSWKDLAQANKLKPPYAITPGDTLKVPPKK